jgi:lysosomal acid lipase/cholesteryl ester hydrolase
MKASPNFLFLLFGRRAILSSATMWEAILYPPIFVRLIDLSLSFLFGWKCENISPLQKLAAYPHLYSFSSTKSIVHWFQIIRNGKFQMYDDDVRGPFSFSDSSKYYKVAKFPTRNIKTPIVLVYGGSDSLVDIDVMLKELPKHTQVKEVPHYEHLDFLWAADVEEHVHPVVFDALEKSTRGARFDVSGEYARAGIDELLQLPTAMMAKKYQGSEEGEDYDSGKKHSASRAEATHTPNSSRTRLLSAAASHSYGAVASSLSAKNTAPPTSSQPATDRATRPEGWWSSDDDRGESTEPATSVGDAPASAVAAGDAGKGGALGEEVAQAVLPAGEDELGGIGGIFGRTRKKKKKVRRGEDDE